MSHHQHLVLRQKVEDFAGYLFPVIERFPQRERFALVTQIKNKVYEIIQISIRIEKAKNKASWLYEADVQLEQLRSLCRHALARRYLSARRHGVVAERVAELGRIIGGLLRRTQGARP